MSCGIATTPRPHGPGLDTGVPSCDRRARPTRHVGWIQQRRRARRRPGLLRRVRRAGRRTGRRGSRDLRSRLGGVHPRRSLLARLLGRSHGVVRHRSLRDGRRRRPLRRQLRRLTANDCSTPAHAVHAVCSDHAPGHHWHCIPPASTLNRPDGERSRGAGLIDRFAHRGRQRTASTAPGADPARSPRFTVAGSTPPPPPASCADRRCRNFAAGTTSSQRPCAGTD